MTMINRTWIYRVLLSLSVCALSMAATAEQLAPPNMQTVDRWGVNIASAQVTTSLNTVSIGGKGGLTHQISTHSNNFLREPDMVGAEIGVSDIFSTTAHYEPLLAPTPNKSYVYKGVTYSWFDVMRVFDGSGSVAFAVRVNGVPTGIYRSMCNPTCPTNFSYEVLNDGTQKGDLRNSLVVNGNYLDWTKPDGTVVQFYGAGTNAAATRHLSSITYPNGYKITVTRRQLNDSPVVSVTTNTGLQLMYVYTDDNRILAGDKSAAISNPATANSKHWSYYNPKYVYAINNAIEICNPQPSLPESTAGGTRASLPACTKTWPYAQFSWPAGMPKAFYVGDSTMSVTTSLGAVTEYRIRAMDKAVAVVGGNPETGKWFVPRLIGVKSAASQAVDLNYTYKNVTGISCIMTWCYPHWYALEAGVLETASGAPGTTAYGVNLLASGSPAPITYTSGGGGLRVYTVTEANGGVNEAHSQDSITYFEVSPRNFPTKVAAKWPVGSAPTQNFYYDARGNLNRIVKNEGLANQATVLAEYPATCTNLKTCNQATWIADAKGNKTWYTYHAASGQVETVTLPADKNGKIAQTRYEYTPLYAWVQTAAGRTQAATPIYMKTAERYCVKNTYIGSGDGNSVFSGNCGTGDQEVITRYEYNSDNLFLTATTVTADSITKRTCYQYDIYGNRIGETKPNGQCTN